MALTCCKSESQTSRRSSVSEAMPILSKWSPPIIPPLMEELNPFKSIVVVIILFFSIFAYFSVFFSKHLLYEQKSTENNKNGTEYVDVLTAGPSQLPKRLLSKANKQL